jgi:hypothetical protein
MIQNLRERKFERESKVQSNQMNANAMIIKMNANARLGDERERNIFVNASKYGYIALSQCGVISPIV